jgi:hypothetical protein
MRNLYEDRSSTFFMEGGDTIEASKSFSLTNPYLPPKFAEIILNLGGVK